MAMSPADLSATSMCVADAATPIGCWVGKLILSITVSPSVAILVGS